ncbi:pyrroline-5-carboxylate reductase [Leucobacter ruminantium]|nr:pyrroline-5-carboxylate reductase [Leucobacter ruminantium]
MDENAAPTAQAGVELPSTAMIGVGSMGGAILEGLRAPGLSIPKPIAVTTRSAESARQYADADDVAAYAGETEPDANRIAVRGAGLVVLGVKPWMIVDVARGIADALEPGAIVVSVAAGVPSAAIEAVLPAGVQVVRAMPNTPSHIGRGVTGVAGGASATAAAVETVRALFETVGSVLVVREEQINDIAAVSGSGPAYLFLYAEEMMAAAERLGFDPAQARTLVEGTIAGAAELLVRSGEEPAQLRRNVTSPKGTTEQAIKVLQAAGWGELFDRALAANIRRSEELAAQ